MFINCSAAKYNVEKREEEEEDIEVSLTRRRL
jgi:hypothetical protein